MTAKKQRSPLGIRMHDSEREALEKAAKADERATAWLARKIIVEWLKANGHL